MIKMKEKLQGKIYIGSSMGAFMVSTNYVLSLDSQDTTSVHQGLGILPINILAHWDAKNKKSEKIKLLKDKSNLPILTLNESEFATLVI